MTLKSVCAFMDLSLFQEFSHCIVRKLRVIAWLFLTGSLLTFTFNSHALAMSESCENSFGHDLSEESLIRAYNEAEKIANSVFIKTPNEVNELRSAIEKFNRKIKDVSGLLRRFGIMSQVVEYSAEEREMWLTTYGRSWNQIDKGEKSLPNLVYLNLLNSPDCTLRFCKTVSSLIHNQHTYVSLDPFILSLASGAVAVKVSSTRISVQPQQIFEPQITEVIQHELRHLVLSKLTEEHKKFASIFNTQLASSDSTPLKELPSAYSRGFSFDEIRAYTGTVLFLINSIKANDSESALIYSKALKYFEIIIEMTKKFDLMFTLIEQNKELIQKTAWKDLTPESGLSTEELETALATVSLGSGEYFNIRVNDKSNGIKMMFTSSQALDYSGYLFRNGLTKDFTADQFSEAAMNQFFAEVRLGRVIVDQILRNSDSVRNSLRSNNSVEPRRLMQAIYKPMLEVIQKEKLKANRQKNEAD